MRTLLLILACEGPKYVAEGGRVLELIKFCSTSNILIQCGVKTKINQRRNHKQSHLIPLNLRQLQFIINCSYIRGRHLQEKRAMHFEIAIQNVCKDARCAFSKIMLHVCCDQDEVGLQTLEEGASLLYLTNLRSIF